MLDLDALCAKTTEITLHGELLHIRVPGMGTVRRLLELENCPEAEREARQLAVAGEILNNNAEGRILTASELERLPPAALFAVLTAAVELVSKVTDDPD